MNAQVKLYDSADHWIYTETKGIVQSGPFTGMLLLQERAWKDENLKTQCLGCYEQELHSAIEYEIEHLSKLENPKIIDIGCAEGYYAIGLGRRLPHAVIYAVDISEECLKIAHRAAALNGVKIITGASMAEVMDKPDLVIVDVEGQETDYLNMRHFPDLAKADIIVECHDTDGKICTDILMDRFSGTHDIELIFEGARDPNKFEFLRRAESLHRWMAVCEGRPCMMNWLVMKPK